VLFAEPWSGSKLGCQGKKSEKLRRSTKPPFHKRPKKNQASRKGHHLKNAQERTREVHLVFCEVRRSSIAAIGKNRIISKPPRAAQPRKTSRKEGPQGRHLCLRGSRLSPKARLVRKREKKQVVVGKGGKPHNPFTRNSLMSKR